MAAQSATSDLNVVRESVGALARALKRAAVYRHAPDQHAGFFEQALGEMRSLLEVKQSFTVAVAMGGLLYEGEVVHSEPARDNNFCFRLYRDGVRSLTFKRGLTLEELTAFARVAMADAPGLLGDREDAVTELWKADFTHLGYSAGSGYRMDESVGEGVPAAIGEIAERVQTVLDRHVGERFMESASAQPLLWNETQRAKGDPQDWARLAARASITILRIVREDFAGWDLDALRDTFARLCAGMLDHDAAAPLALALAALRALAGSQGPSFRDWVAKRLAEPALLAKVVQAAGAPRFAHIWLELLPLDCGAGVLAVLPLARDPGVRSAVAEAVLERIESCPDELAETLRTGRAPELRPLLSGLASLHPSRRAEMAAAAVRNRDLAVAAEAIPHIASDVPLAVKVLGPLLTHDRRELRVAAAEALAGCTPAAESIAALFIEAIARPTFSQTDDDERNVFYRSLGKLGASAGYNFLAGRLTQEQPRLFGRKRLLDEQLLAVQGLAQDGSLRALRALEDAAAPDKGLPREVAAACRAAAQHVRTRKNA